MHYFTTYFDKNYISRGLLAADSLQKLNFEFKIFVLALDVETYDFFSRVNLNRFAVFSLSELEAYDTELASAKPSRKKHEYYFSLTPSLIKYIFYREPSIDLLTYIDADIYFFSSPQIIFEELADKSILIVPHNFSLANKGLEIFGKYNVVFNSFRNDEHGNEALSWWRNECIAWCYDYLDGEKYADQKYLDQFENLFEKVVVCKNPGVNLAGFNVDNFELRVSNNMLLVNGCPLVFYHYHHLIKLNKYIYRPYKQGVWNINLIGVKPLMFIYKRYIELLQKTEKAYELNSLNSGRFNTNALKMIFGDVFLYDNILIVSPFYSGFVRMSFVHKAYTFVKRLLKLNNN